MNISASRYLVLAVISIFNFSSYSQTYSEISNDLSVNIKIATEVGYKNTQESIAGSYIEHGDTLSHDYQITALSNSVLYLFSDGTYIFLRSGDIMPRTIYEKGLWNHCNQFVCLERKDKLTKRDYISKKLVPYTHVNGRRFLMEYERYKIRIKELLETDEDVGDFKFMALLYSYENYEDKEFSDENALANKLMNNYWRPEWFQEEE